MKVVLVADKPSAVAPMIKAVMSVYPEYDVDDFLVYHRHRFINLNRMFKFSHGHKYAEHPLLEDAMYHDFFTCDETDTIFKSAHSVIVDATMGDHIKRVPIDGSDTIEFVVNNFTNAERIYVGFSSRYDGDPHLQLRLRDWLRSHSVNCRELTLSNWASFSHMDTVAAIEKAKYIEYDDLLTLATPSIIKRYFDFNFLQNSFAVMQKTAQESIGNPLQQNLKKHELQMLYNIRSGPLRNGGQLVLAMMNWTGTGRYDSRNGSFGSPSSRANYIEVLIANGLVKRTPADVHMEHGCTIDNVVISEKGLRFLDWLHPDCEDPDQVFRIEEWSHLPFGEAKVKIDRYIKTYFGKQKRFLVQKLAESSK